MPPCLEDLHGYTVVVVKGGQNRYFHSLYLRKQAKTPFSNCWSYVKKKYKLNVTNFPFFVIVNSLSLLRPFPSFSDIVPHIHLETNIHNDYEYGLYYRMFQYIWTVLLFQLRQ